MVKTGELQAQKSQLRKLLKERRKQIGAGERRRISNGIVKQLTQLKDYKKAEIIFCYIGIAEEIDTIPLIHDAWKKGKRVGVPRCTGKGEMTVYEIHQLSDLKPGNYGILEPEQTLPAILPESIDLALVPCISCSSNGVRLGYGGGYYDRYLPGISGKKLALCSQDMMCEEIPKEDHDCEMDGVVTEKFVIFC